MNDSGKIEIIVDYTDNYSATPVNESVACVSTGRTLEELQRNMDDALHFHIEGLLLEGMPVPDEYRQASWEYDWQLTARALLHYTEGLIPKSAISKETGINQQQLTHYASGYRIPRPAMRKRILDGIHSIAARLAAIS
jgi:predicted RNase H-like HicB family nuclease